MVGVILFTMGLIYNYLTNQTTLEAVAYKASAFYKQKFTSESLNPNIIGLMGLLFGYMLVPYYFLKGGRAPLLLSVL